MPTYEASPKFQALFGRLSSADQDSFRVAVGKFVADLTSGNGFRAGLRVKRVQKLDSCWEMTWAPNGRAIFSYGAERRSGHVHVQWHYIGDHDGLP